MTAPKRLACLVFLIVAELSLASCTNTHTPATSESAPAGDFTLAASPTSISLAQGASSPLSVNVAAVNGLTGNVSVAISGLPTGISVSPQSPFSVGVGSSVSITLSAATSAALGSVTLNLQGSQGSLSHSATEALTVAPMPNFSIAIQPGSVGLTQGGTSQPVSVAVTPLNAFTGNVAISLVGLPPGVAASTGSSFNVAAGGSQSITFTAASSAAPGTVNVMLQASSGSLSHSAGATLQVQAAILPDFDLAVLPGLVAVTQGQSSHPVSVAVTPINGFTSDVAVAVSGLPAGVTASPSTLTVPAGSSAPVTFYVPANTPAGSATLTFTGTGDSITHSATAMMQTLTDPVFSITYFDTTITTPTPDETLRIVNPGIQSTTSTTGDLCANIYVFDPSQELEECCSCPVTANGSLALSVTTDLTSNPDNGVPITSGTIAVIPGTGACDATTPTPAPDLAIWGTHLAPGVNRAGAVNAAVVETRAEDLTLSGSEETELASLCSMIVANDSGFGICSCTGEVTDGARTVARR
ncbi:MAG: hypothetical protein WB795_10305 [Candidatus Acidiferrales bacterium]